jgi:hypothetical protein
LDKIDLAIDALHHQPRLILVVAEALDHDAAELALADAAALESVISNAARQRAQTCHVISPDQRQADVVLDYIDANFRSSPVLAQLIETRICAEPKCAGSQGSALHAPQSAPEPERSLTAKFLDYEILDGIGPGGGRWT